MSYLFHLSKRDKHAAEAAPNPTGCQRQRTTSVASRYPRVRRSGQAVLLEELHDDGRSSRRKLVCARMDERHQGRVQLRWINRATLLTFPRLAFAALVQFSRRI